MAEEYFQIFVGNNPGAYIRHTLIGTANTFETILERRAKKGKLASIEALIPYLKADTATIEEVLLWATEHGKPETPISQYDAGDTRVQIPPNYTLGEYISSRLPHFAELYQTFLEPGFQNQQLMPIVLDKLKSEFKRNETIIGDPYFHDDYTAGQAKIQNEKIRKILVNYEDATPAPDINKT